MRKLHLSVLSLSLLVFSSRAMATAMSDERSKCFGMESIAREYRGWKTDLHRFFAEYDSLSPDLRYRVSVSAMTKVVDEIVRLKKAGDVDGHDAVVSDANRLVSELNSGHLTQAGSMSVLKSGLSKLEEAMDDTVYRAQVKNNCQLEVKAQSAGGSAAGAPVK